MSAGSTAGGIGKLDSKRVRVVLYEGSGSQPLPNVTRAESLRTLLEDGHSVTRPPLHGHHSPVSTADDNVHLVLGRFETTPVSTAVADYVDIEGLDTEAIRAAVAERVAAAGATTNATWKPWFPVIDYDRCTNCMQCLTFCLFDVYGIEDVDETGGDKKIAVQIQDNCKTDCPACSRVCPEAAILFPKYKAGPINGDAVTDDDLQREAMKVDISALLGGDIYQALRERSATARNRFSTERDESKALLERRRWLKKLQKDLDIPDEVLMTLPSAGDIEERTRRARAKAERRKGRSQSMQDRRSATAEDWDI